MKAILISGALTLILLPTIIMGCGGSSTGPHIGSPIGPFLFMVGQTSGNVFSFKASDSGAISPLASTASGRAPTAIVMQSFSTFQMSLYVTDASTSNLSVLNLDPATGMVSQTGISVPVGTNPIAIGLRGASGTVSNGQVDRGDIYVLNLGSNSISAFRISDVAGHMAPIPGSPFGTAANPQAIAVVTGGTSLSTIATFVYVANGNQGTISGFKANVDGSLTEVAGSPFAAGANISGLASRAGGTILLASDSVNNTVKGFKIDAAGALTPFPGAPVAAGLQPGALLFSFNDFVYVVNRASNNISAYKFDFASTSLTPVPGSPFTAGTTPVALGTTRPLQLYVANQGSSNVSGFNIDQTTGALTPIAGSPFAAPTAPNSIQTLFVMNVD